MRIGELARQTGATVATIRYYERLGLLPRAFRVREKQRVYHAGDITRVRFVRRCRKLGFSLSDIASFTDVARNKADNSSCRKIVQRRLTEVQSEISALHATETRLMELLSTQPVGSACPQLAEIR